MLNTLTLLLLFQLGGELCVRALALPIPGPVIGMILLFLTLLAKGHVGQETRLNTAALLQHYRKNTLLSVFCATAVYMALLRLFA